MVGGGKGGSGCVSFARAAHEQWGGPDGANGGQGGNVFVEAKSDLLDLARDKYTYMAENGAAGAGNQKIGRAGRDIVIFVPVGTLVKLMPAKGDIEEDESFEDELEERHTKISEILENSASSRGGPAVRRHRFPTRRQLAENRAAERAMARRRLESGGDGESDAAAAVAEGVEVVRLPRGGFGGGGGSVSLDGHVSIYEHWRRMQAAAAAGGGGRRDGVRADRRVDIELDSGEAAAGEAAEVEEEAAAEEVEEKAAMEVLGDLDQPGQRVLVAVGGRGGRGNMSFSTKKNRAPRTAEQGSKGQKFRLELELKILADVGLIGYPNAGKSSLLRAMSRATPKVAAYPFTTLRPHVGMVDLPDEFEVLSVADLPGLIEGAHDNVGLGHAFLRHVERNKVLAYVVDVVGSEGRDPLCDLLVLEKELELYLPGLSRRAGLIIANKMDLPGADEQVEHLKEGLRRLEDDRGPSALTQAHLVPVSAQRGGAAGGLPRLITSLRDAVRQRAAVRTNPHTGLPDLSSMQAWA